MDLSVSKLLAVAQNGCPLTIYARIIWNGTPKHCFEIIIFESNNSWSGSLSQQQADKFRDDVEESEECYGRNLRQYLSRTCEMCCYDFLVSSKDPCKATFKWKIKFDESSALITHGYVTLSLDDPPKCKTVLIDSLMYEQCSIQACVSGYEQKIAALEATLQSYKVELEKFMVMNNQFEATLYAKFMNLLNSKRKKVESLQIVVDGLKKNTCVKCASLTCPLPVVSNKPLPKSSSSGSSNKSKDKKTSTQCCPKPY